MDIYRVTVSICGQTMVFGVLIKNASTYIVNVKYFHEDILSTYSYQIYQIQLIQNDSTKINGKCIRDT